jgi:hypothetical protein
MASHNGRFTFETAVRRFQKRNGHLDPEVVYYWFGTESVYAEVVVVVL